MNIKKIIALAITAALLLSLGALFPLAAEEQWIFIDGINITRSVNTAVIYRDISSTGQNQWGHNIVVSAENTVTDIIEGGDAAGENLAVPEGGMVISASGTKVEWFQSNIKKGSKVSYDPYSRRLFICDAEGSYSPFFSREAAVSGGESSYYISNPALEGTPVYSFTVAVDANGYIIARGSNASAPEGGFTLSAGTKTDVEFLKMYAPIGGECSVEGNKANFSYDRTLLPKTLELAIFNAKSALNTAKSQFMDFDLEKAEALIAAAEEAKAQIPNSKTAFSAVFNQAYILETELSSLLTESPASELRAAFHTPSETSIGAVRQTLNSLKDSGLNSVILRLSNGYGSFIPLPEDFKFRQDSKFNGFDVLDAYISLCEEMDISLTLCVDVYYNEYASVAAPNWLSETNGSSKKVANVFFSPASTEFSDYYVSYIEYIITHYNIKSLMFDSLRYPRFSETGDLGYDSNTLNRFAEKHQISSAQIEKLKTDLFSSAHWKKWVEFRADLVDTMAMRLSEAVRAKRSDITLSVVAARDTVDHYYMQNATDWINEGLFDGLCVSLTDDAKEESNPIPELGYTDDFVYEKASTYKAYTADKAFLFGALECGETVSTAELSDAIKALRSLGAEGFVLSSLDSYLSQHRETLLKQGPLARDAVSPLGDTEGAVKAILEYSKNKISNALVSLGGCTEATAALAGAKLNDALQLLNSGELTAEASKALESDLAVLLAEMPAKNEALKEIKAVTKLLMLAKAESGTVVTPPIDEPDTSTPAEDSSHSESSEAESGGEDTVSTPLYPLEEEESGIDIGSILIYAFVGIALVAAIIGAVVSVKRAKAKPANRHLPKAAIAERNEDDQNPDLD